MSAFKKLLGISDEEKKAMGLEYTPVEIAQQPGTWAKAVGILREQRDEIVAFMKDAGMAGKKKAIIYVTGAGTSEFVGTSVYHALGMGLGRSVQSVPTTHFVTHAADYFTAGNDYVVISFARSGNSPESMATYNLVKKIYPDAKQVAITCNVNGELAKAARKDKGALYIQLPDETNDESLVMTSSFSTMAFTALGLTMMDDLDGLEKIAGAIGAAGERIIDKYGDMLKGFAEKDFSRACFLGSGALWGTMQECMLKLQEMTEGKVASKHDSFLGLRHGPQVFVDGTCVVVAALSSDKFIRRYEMDMLKELKAKGQGAGTLVICDKADDEIRKVATDIIELFPDGDGVDDSFRVMTDVMVGQIIGTFKSINVGLKPDNPSTSGTINRVVQGVVIYEKE